MFLVETISQLDKKKKAKSLATAKSLLHSCSFQSANENLHQIEKYCLLNQSKAGKVYTSLCG